MLATRCNFVTDNPLAVAFFYDIFWVFCSSRSPFPLKNKKPNASLFSRVFGANVMVTVATQLNVPIKILVIYPLHLPPPSSISHPCLLRASSVR
jgi:hypothetical protein